MCRSVGRSINAPASSGVRAPLPVGDLGAGVDFYVGVLGLSIAKRFDRIGTILFQVGNETPGLGIAETHDLQSGAYKVWFEVDDARAAADDLIAAGVTATRPPFQIPTGWAVEVTDPWGNTIGLTDYSTKPELGRSWGQGYNP